MVDTGLEGRVAVVTGANHGVGAATARALAAQGAAVLITYLRLPVEDAGVSGAAAASGPGQALYRTRQATPADEMLARISREGDGRRYWRRTWPTLRRYPRSSRRPRPRSGRWTFL